jgi:hypothetical protein
MSLDLLAIFRVLLYRLRKRDYFGFSFNRNLSFFLTTEVELAVYANREVRAVTFRDLTVCKCR